MKVAFYSPMPPLQTGVADYSASLAGALGELVDLSVNPIQSAGLNVYHLGNNSLHREIYFHSLREPGVVVIHDAVLHHFLMGTLDESAYVAEFVYNYGEWSRSLASELWANRKRSGGDARYFEYPMLRRVAESARLVVVHNRAARAIVERHAPGAHVVEIPHLYQPPAAIDLVAVERLRASWGATSSACVFAVFGHLREAKRISVVVRAFEAIRRQNQKVFLLLAGPAGSLDMVRQLEHWATLDGVIRVGHTPLADFEQLCAAADVCLNLRYPSAGEASGMTVRLMGMGKPVVMSDGLDGAGYPAGTVVKIAPNAGEQALLEEYMRWLAGSVRVREEMGRAAAHHIASEHCLTRVAQMYRDVLLSC